MSVKHLYRAFPRLSSITRTRTGGNYARIATDLFFGTATALVAAGALALVGYPPTVTASSGGSGVTVNAPLGTLVLTPFAPTVSAPATVSPPAGSLVLTAFVPVVTNGAAVTTTPYGGVCNIRWGESVVNINYDSSLNKSSSVSQDKTNSVVRVGQLS
jgi:hypothetical protein